MRLLGLVFVVVLTACGVSKPLTPPLELVQPPCGNPSPLLGQFDPEAPGFIVIYRPGIDAQLETNRLSAQYGFSPRSVYTHATQGFSALLEPSVVASVRCEPSVAYVEYDARVRIAGSAGS